MDKRKYAWQPDYCEGRRLTDIRMQDEGEDTSLRVQNENKDLRKRTKRGASVATGNDPNDDGHDRHVNKGKGKDDERQGMSDDQSSGKTVLGVAAANELHGTGRENVAAVDDDEVQVLQFSDQHQKTSDNQDEGKQVVEGALHGGDDGDDDCVMIDAERFRKATEGKFAPVDKNYGEESEDDIFASLEMIENLNRFEAEQDEPNTNKTNVEKGKEPIIVDETRGGKEPVTTGEEETERERIASRAREQEKGILEMADSEEESEQGKTNEEQDQQEGRSKNALLVKKPRLVWTHQLHYKFIAAVQTLANDACPKSVHRMMNEPNLTRRHVASHLQQYRAQLRRNREKKAPSETPYNARYAYLPRPEVSKVLKKSREIVDQLTKQMSRRHAYGFSRTPSFLAPNFSATFSRLNNYQVPITSAQTTQRRNSSSAQLTIDHAFNVANLATTSINVNQNSIVNATLKPNPGYVPKAENFLTDSSERNLDSRAIGISDPASANVPIANECPTDFNLGDVETDAPLTSAEATQRLNSSSAVNLATTFSNVNQNPDGNATANLNPGYVSNGDIFPTGPTVGKPDSGAMGMGLGDMETDVLAPRTTPVNLPCAYEMPISFTDGNQKSNEGVIINPTSALEPKTNMYSMKSNDVNQKLMAISDPTGCNVSSIKSLLMDCSDGKEKLHFMDNLPNLQEFLKECSDHHQEAGVMEISSPTRRNVRRIGSLLMECTDGKEELDFMDNVPNLQEFLRGCCEHQQEAGAMSISNPTGLNVCSISLLMDCTDGKEELDFTDNVPNLQEFLKECCDHKQEAGVMAISDPALGISANCNVSVQEPNAMASANLTPGGVPYANISTGYSTNGNQELEVMAPSNHTAGYAYNSSNYGMDPANGTAVSFPHDSLSNANHSESEFANLWWLLKEDSFDYNFMDAKPNPWDVDHYWESLCNYTTHGSSPKL